ncbi:MAG: ammonia-forming cytochrome c nitrite reductase subunit c552 [Planctomycetota bacterium]|nr:ammonia-forming cytochrome c nitrite reductase subunit c552 [Planctomycetota bacterium]
MTEAGTPKKSRLPIIGAIVISSVVCFGLAALLMNIFEKKQEGRNPFFRVVELDDTITDPKTWGKNFPLQYDDFIKTVDMVRTRYGGSEAMPRSPTLDDPRTFTSRSKLDMIPQLKRMWAGYAFAMDFREARGHAYVLEDQLYTGRQSVPQPGTCLQCHASTYTAMMELGDGDLFKGFEALNRKSYLEARAYVNHAVACIDCHDPNSMQLRVTRPAFMEGIAATKAHDGIKNYDVNAMATRQEMRTYVCAQCHVEYYFAGENKRLKYPWSKGLKVEDALAYYDEIGFKDWTHAETGAPMLKAQHPEFEMWSQGTHARRGVSCPDCHMPFKRVGAVKISDHHVRSPLLNINNACQTCHKVPEQELLSHVESIQDRHVNLVHKTLDALVDLVDDLKAAKEGGATDEQLAEARDLHRKGSFYVDFVEAENSSGFHAAQEAARILAESIDFSRRGQLALRDIKGGNVKTTARPGAQKGDSAGQ